MVDFGVIFKEFAEVLELLIVLQLKLLTKILLIWQRLYFSATFSLCFLVRARVMVQL